MPADYRTKALERRLRLQRKMEDVKEVERKKGKAEVVKQPVEKVSLKTRRRRARKRREQGNNSKQRPLQEVLDPFAALDAGLESDDVPPPPPLLVRQSSAFTGNMFNCLQPGCDGCMCLLCNKTMTKSEQFSHECKALQEEHLEAQLMDLLAVNSAQV